MPMDPTELLQPLAGANPAGSNLRYAPLYDQLKQARTEEDDLPQGDWKRAPKKADWAQVVKLATEVLRKQSKDLQVGVWLTEALLWREGFAGLRSGLTLLHGLLDAFWDNVYPELEDGDAEMRAAPLEWLGNYYDEAGTKASLTRAVGFIALDTAGHDVYAYRQSRLVPTEEEANLDSDKSTARQQALADGKLTPEEFDESFRSTPKEFYRRLAADIDAAAEALDAFDSLCTTRFGEAAPSFKRLREAIAEVRQVVRQLLARKLEQDPDPVGLEPEPAAAAKVMGGPADDTVSTASAGTTPAGISATPRSREDAASRVAAAAKYMRAETPADPAPYLMLRGLRWGELRAGGPQVDARLLAAPPTDVRTRLKSLLLDARWEELLEAGEDVMASPWGRGWLDLQRYVLTACDGLGGEFAHVAAAIRGALRSLLADLPDLLGMTLMDDSPTANAETRAWLRENGLLEEGAIEATAEDGEAAASRERPRPGRDPYEIALERVRSGHADKAIDLLMREAAQEKSERARFLRRSQAASVMVQAGLEEVAMPILQELSQLIERHVLEEWEAGETVAQPLGLLYRCMGKLDFDDGTRRELYLRVCRLDPMQAIQFAAGRHDEQTG